MAERTKQGHLEGLEPPTIEEVEEKADAYYSLNDKSWKLRGKVEQARDELLETMKKHELTTYEYGNKVVSVVEKEIVKIKKRKPEAESNDDE